ncbi:MAG: class I SAM-dependent methyltransferase [Saprospiraceae bacterium]|nr:class I SAM-dependent methyltransferase [Saprospiraceae bacterium]
MFNEYPKEVFNTTSAENILKELFELIQPKSVLDVGCGNGSWLKVFHKNYEIEDILGVDGFYVAQRQPPDSIRKTFHEADLSKTH